MRKLCLSLLAATALAVPSTALADRTAAAAVTARTDAGDGSLVVLGGNGRLTVTGSGLIWGTVARGAITVVGNYVPNDPTALPTVSGARLLLRGGNVVYVGSYVRFLFPAGTYTLIVDGVGIDFSAVGAGTFSAVGLGLPDDGTYSTDGARPQPIDNLDPGGTTYGNIALKAMTTTVSTVRLRNSG